MARDLACCFPEAHAAFQAANGIDIEGTPLGQLIFPRPASSREETAQQEEADMIMITSRGRGSLDYIMIGSVAQRIVENTEVPVFIVPAVETRSEHYNPYTKYVS